MNTQQEGASEGKAIDKIEHLSDILSDTPQSPGPAEATGAKEQSQGEFQTSDSLEGSDELKDIELKDKQELNPELGTESLEEALLKAEKEEVQEGNATAHLDAEALKESLENTKDSNDEDKEVPEPVFITQIKDFRKGLHRISEMADCIDHTDKLKISASLLKSKAWLGKLLEQVGSASPYSGEHAIRNVQDIPATAEAQEFEAAEKSKFKLENDLDRVIGLRYSILNAIDALEGLDINNYEEVKNKRFGAIAITQAYVHACEARFECGNILAQMKR